MPVNMASMCLKWASEAGSVCFRLLMQMSVSHKIKDAINTPVPGRPQVLLENIAKQTAATASSGLKDCKCIYESKNNAIIQTSCLISS